MLAHFQLFLKRNRSFEKKSTKKKYEKSGNDCLCIGDNSNMSDATYLILAVSECSTTFDNLLSVFIGWPAISSLLLSKPGPYLAFLTEIGRSYELIGFPTIMFKKHANSYHDVWAWWSETLGIYMAWDRQYLFRLQFLCLEPVWARQRIKAGKSTPRKSAHGYTVETRR